MKRNILPLFVSIAVACSTLFPATVKAQTKDDGEQIEQITLGWNAALENVRVKYAASKADFETFSRFEANALQQLRTDNREQAKKEQTSSSSVAATMQATQKSIELLYEKFLTAKKTYPSSVSEYAHAPHNIATSNPCDSSGCTNMDFVQGTLNTWYGYWAVNNGPPITTWTGGPLGAVTVAVNDPSTSNPHPDYQLLITSSGYDRIVPSIPRVSPWATGGHSVMLGDSTEFYQGAAMLTKTFMVNTNTANLTYQYAVFLENPGHAKSQQPFFVVAVLDQNGDTIPNCGAYNVTSGYGTSNFDSTTYLGNKTYYRDWTIVNVPLKNYIGQCVTIVFQVADCSLGGHFGYAYVDATCSPLGLISSSPGFCGQDSVLLTAPPGAAKYTWTGPAGPPKSILSDSTKQSVWIDTIPGTYTVICVPVTGAQCADTLTITIGKAVGPPPHPSFRADTVCAGKATTFKNISTPSSGRFSWDFYDIGVYNLTDTNNFNPQWTYVTPGTYHVKLHEVYNGCGYDTVITIVVDTIPKATFTMSGSCTGVPVTFTNSSSGGQKYLWNFGGGPNDTSTAFEPTHTYTAATTYTVTLVVGNAGECKDTIKQAITIYPQPSPVIKGNTPICPGASDTLSVSGGTTYKWTINGSTSTTLVVKPTVTTTYTVEAFNGTCEVNNTFTVTVVPAPSPVITETHDSVCKGDTLTLEASGATTYLWSPRGGTSTKIQVTITDTVTYILNGYTGCPAATSIHLGLIKQIAATATQSVDSICPGASVTLNATVTGDPAQSYSWSDGTTNSYPATPTIIVSPTVTTTYTSTVVGKCNTVTNKLTVVVVPPPKPVITGSPWKCHGVIDTLFVTSSTNPTKYVWGNGKTTTSIKTGAIDNDSIFYVIASNALGCSDTVYYKVALRHPPVITTIPPKVACAGSNVLLTATASGTGPFNYSWKPGGQTTDTITVSPNVVTDYTVTVTNGCTTSKGTVVTPDNPNVNACCDKAIIIGDDTVIGAYGKGIRTYEWLDTNGIVCLNPKCDSIRVTPTVTTTYTLYATDTLGCQTERIITIVVEIPCFNITVPNVITPNYPGPNGVNQEFYIKTEYMDGWSVVIYDRWGKEMFKTNNPNVYWQCLTESGAKASDGVYYYIISGTCQQRTYKKQGFVQVIR